MKPERVKRLRKKLRMTQQEFAEHIGLASKTHICHIEKGRVAPTPMLNKLLKLLESGAEMEK